MSECIPKTPRPFLLIDSDHQYQLPTSVRASLLLLLPLSGSLQGEVTGLIGETSCRHITDRDGGSERYDCYETELRPVTAREGSLSLPLARSLAPSDNEFVGCSNGGGEVTRWRFWSAA